MRVSALPVRTYPKVRLRSGSRNAHHMTRRSEFSNELLASGSITLVLRPSDAHFCASGTHVPESTLTFRFSKRTPYDSQERILKRTLGVWFHYACPAAI
jgi:hypothetical protein